VEDSLALSAVAFAVGILVGMTGVGAGALMTPLLISVFGIPITTAVATDLIFASVTKLIGVGFHHRGGDVRWDVARTLWSGSLPGVALGVAIILFVAGSSYTEWLVWPLAIMILLTAGTLVKRVLPSWRGGKTPRASGESGFTRNSRAIGVFGGFGVGLAVALTSVGAGALGMALLVKLSPDDTKPQELVGTDLVHAIPIALVAGAAYGTAGFVSWSLLTALLIGSAPGVIIGALTAGKLPPQLMNIVLAGALMAAGVMTLA